MKLAQIDSLSKEQLYAMCLSLLEATKKTEEALTHIRHAFFDLQQDTKRVEENPEAEVRFHGKEDGEIEIKAHKLIAHKISDYLKWEGGFLTACADVSRIRDRVEKEFKRYAAKEWLTLMEFIESVDPNHWDDPDTREEHLFNECRLYDALGKDDARSVLSVWVAYQKARAARARIGLVGEPEAKDQTEKEFFRFGDTELFGRMHNLLDWGLDMALKSELTEKWKKDKHAPKQFENFKKRASSLLGQFKEAGKKLRGKEE